MTDLIDPADIALGFAPQRREAVSWVNLDGEAVVYEPDTRAVHKLDRLATSLWSHFDGRADLNELSVDLTTVFHEDRAQVEADLLAFAQALGRAGLLEGVRGTSLQLGQDFSPEAMDEVP